MPTVNVERVFYCLECDRYYCRDKTDDDRIHYLKLTVELDQFIEKRGYRVLKCRNCMYEKIAGEQQAKVKQRE
jgi:hypothetical protein